MAECDGDVGDGWDGGEFRRLLNKPPSCPIAFITEFVPELERDELDRDLEEDELRGREFPSGSSM